MANSVKIATQNPRLKNQSFKPFEFLYVDNLNDLLPLNLSQQVTPDIALVNMMIAIGERVTGIADPNLGRETRLGGHPSPATNTLVQLQEGAKVLNTTLRLVRKQLSTAGEWIAALYQQHGLEDEGRLAQRLGQADAERLRQIAVAPENVQFDLHALSESVNPDAERNSAVMISQLNSNYYGFVLRMLAIIENPQAQATPGMKEAAMKAIESQTKTHVRILEASDVDEADQFIYQLQQSRFQDARQIQQFRDAIAARAGAAGEAEGAFPGGGVGDLVAGAGNGQAGPPGAAGSGFNF
jgi:hypothetical protein